MAVGTIETDKVFEEANGLILAGQFRAANELLSASIETVLLNEKLSALAVFALEEANCPRDAIALCLRASYAFPAAAHFRVWAALMLPSLYLQPSDIDEWRDSYAAGLDSLFDLLSLRTEDEIQRSLSAITFRTNFYLGYQGRNDLELQRKYSSLLHSVASARFPQFSKPRQIQRRQKAERIRVGYVSAHFRNHSVTKLFGGWIEEHDRDQFEVFVYHNGQTVDDLTNRIRRSAEHFIHLPNELEKLCDLIRADDLDILVYLDVRHRRMSVMSSLRLAPIQCLAWAHPVTSGSPNIDYFLSSDTMEPDNGAEHYSETLVRLPGIGVFYHTPLKPKSLLTKTRSDFGFADDRPLYLCCQALFKYLPQHDDIFVEIARRDDRAQFAFLGLNDEVDEVFRQRLAVSFSRAGIAAENHVTILPQLSWLNYLNLNLVSDVFLDSLEWSGGVTALEALACELPIVTLPGEFMRGRHSYGILRQAGLTDFVAADKQQYVSHAIRLATDPTANAEARMQIRERAGKLFHDKSSVRALENFYVSATSLASRSTAPATPGVKSAV